VRIHMAYDDMDRCPQTEEEFHEYFSTLTGTTYGAPADGWEGVMEAAYPWQGHQLNIPPGVGPGVRQPPDAPFFGLTQQYSGGPKGRIFLPTDSPDELGYYTRCMQYLDDAVGTYEKSKKQVTAQSTGLIWSWYWVAGAEYAPVTDADGTAPPEMDTCPNTTRVDALEVVVDTLVGEVELLRELLEGGLHAHGPINLPIVLESLTSLRCKGDIDVQVKPGQAIPPNMESDPPPDAATIALLRHLLDMRDEAES
jgi:hypothetical protein